MIERIKITDLAEWLSWRERDVTASEVAGLFGLADPRDDSKTPAAIFWNKRGVTRRPKPNSMMESGLWLEPAVARRVELIRPGWQAIKAEHYYREPEWRLGATPDYFVRGDARGFGVLECKVVEADVYEKFWTDTTPAPWVALQIATQMMLTGFGWGVIAALVLGFRRRDVHLYEVPRHAASEKKIRDRVAEFWRNVEAGIEPAIDYARDGELVPLLYPREEPGKIIDLTGDNRLPGLLAEHDRLGKEISALANERESITTEIKAKIGDAERAVVSGWNITLKLQHRKPIEATSFRVLRTKQIASGQNATGTGTDG